MKTISENADKRRSSTIAKIAEAFMPEKRREREKDTFKNTLQEFAKESSLHGIPKILSSRQWPVKILWLLLFIGTFSLFMIQMVDLFATYYEYNVKTTVKLDFNALPFPSVTVCNMNPVRKSRLEKSKIMDRYIKQMAAQMSSSRKKRDTHQGESIEEVDSETSETTDGLSHIVDGVRKPVKDRNKDVTNGLPSIGDKHIETSPKEEGFSDAQIPIKPTKVNNDAEKGPSWRHTLRTAPELRSKGIILNSYHPSVHVKERRRKREALDSSATTPFSDPASSSEIQPSVTSSDNLYNTGSLSSSYGYAMSSLSSQTTYGLDVDSWCQWYNEIGYYDEFYVYEEGYYQRYEYCWYQFYWFCPGCYSGGSSSAYDESVYDTYGYYDSSNYLDDYELSDEVQADIYRHLYANSRKDKHDVFITRFLFLLRNETEEVRYEMGHQKDDLFQTITYMKGLRNVTETNMKLVSTATYGNCYTLENSMFVAWRSGPNHGLAMTLNLEKFEYIDNVASGFGVRLAIHEHGTYPLPEQEGLTLSPGTETTIGLKQVRIERQGHPYGVCVDGTDFKRDYQRRYSIVSCDAFCRLQKATQVCKCIPVDSPDNAMFSPTALPLCDNSNKTEAKCLVEVDIKFNKGEFTCGCKSPCSETVYEKTVSSTYWPSTYEQTSLVLEEMCKKEENKNLLPCTDSSFDQKEILANWSTNFLKVVIYFEDLNFETIEEKPLYEFVRFLSDIGGQTGLFLGASVLSFLEVIQLLLEIGLFLKRKISGQTRVKSIG